MGAPRAAAVGGNGAAGGRGAGPKTSSGSALGRESGEGEGVRAIWLTRESLGGSGRGRRDGLGVVVERQPWQAARLILGSRGKGWSSALARVGEKLPAIGVVACASGAVIGHGEHARGGESYTWLIIFFTKFESSNFV